MCYNVSYMTKKAERYARKYGYTLDQELKQKLESFEKKYFINAFQFPDMPVITNNKPGLLQFYAWGLIPSFIKDAKKAEEIRRFTLNARAETIFEKPSFKNAAFHQHALVLVDGFFEYHWEGNKSYPFFIRLKNDEPMTLAGIWEKCNLHGNDFYTFSIVTTKANKTMEYIHNNPKASDRSRMPVILPPEFVGTWLREVTDPTDIMQLNEEIFQPLPDDFLVVYPVSRLTGKNGSGNTPVSHEKFGYPELKQF